MGHEVPLVRPEFGRYLRVIYVPEPEYICGNSIRFIRKSTDSSPKTYQKEKMRQNKLPPGHDKDTICRWLDIAGAHYQEVTYYFFQELKLGQMQIDEIWSFKITGF